MDARRFALPGREAWPQIGRTDLAEAIWRRRSRRRFKADALGLDELAFLLWATQGLRKLATPAVTFRTVPSAGARHAFETYLAVARVESLTPGIYRYLPIGHEVVHVADVQDLPARMSAAAMGQTFVAEAAVTFAWAAVPYRMEWRYGLAAHKLMALGAGHLCQNLYLACEAIGAGTCAIAAYEQETLDKLLGVDGVDEFAVYLAPVGRV